MAFLIIIIPFIWLIASAIVKITESASIPSGNSYTFSKNGKTCSIQNGKLFVNGVFKRELTAAEMDEVERWSESFNQLFTHHAQEHMHNGWHNHDHHSHNIGGHGHNHNHQHHNHNHDLHHHDRKGSNDHDPDHSHHSGGRIHINHSNNWPDYNRGHHSQHKSSHENGYHNHDSSYEHDYDNHGSSQDRDDYSHYEHYARDKRQNMRRNRKFGNREWQQLNGAIGGHEWHMKQDTNNDDVGLFHGLSPTTHFPHVCDSV